MTKQKHRHIEECYNGFWDKNCEVIGKYGETNGRIMEEIGEIAGTRIYQCPNCKTIRLWKTK